MSIFKSYEIIDADCFPPVLETQRLLLRPVRLSDADDIFEYASDEENTRYMLWDTHRCKEDTTDFIKFELIQYENRLSYDYAICLKSENQKLIGTGGAFKCLRLPHKVEIGYILNKKYWGKGLMTEAMKAVIDFFTKELKVHRIEAMHFLENAKSGEVMKRLGMKYEGTSIDNVFVRGRYFDCARYALISPIS